MQALPPARPVPCTPCSVLTRFLRAWSCSLAAPVGGVTCGPQRRRNRGDGASQQRRSPAPITGAQAISPHPRASPHWSFRVSLLRPGRMSHRSRSAPVAQRRVPSSRGADPGQSASGRERRAPPQFRPALIGDAWLGSDAQGRAADCPCMTPPAQPLRGGADRPPLLATPVRPAHSCTLPTAHGDAPAAGLGPVCRPALVCSPLPGPCTPAFPTLRLHAPGATRRADLGPRSPTANVLRGQPPKR